jgi:hypothetical protein
MQCTPQMEKSLSVMLVCSRVTLLILKTADYISYLRNGLWCLSSSSLSNCWPEWYQFSREMGRRAGIILICRNFEFPELFYHDGAKLSWRPWLPSGIT